MRFGKLYRAGKFADIDEALCHAQKGTHQVGKTTDTLRSEGFFAGRPVVDDFDPTTSAPTPTAAVFSV